MYIDHRGLVHNQSDSDANAMLSFETVSWESTSDPGSSTLSPDTPSFGPPGDDSPGSSTLSPETPPFGPPADNSPGSSILSPETPPFGPPAGNSPGTSILSPETPPFRPPSGSGSGNVVIVPGRPVFPSRPSGGSASIRFFHAAPNQPAVNVRLANRVVINSLQFGNATPYYLETGDQRIQITITSARNGVILYRGFFYFANQTSYTVAITESGSGISLYILTDSPCNRRDFGCLRAVNLSPNSGAVDVFLSRYGRIFRSVGQLSDTEYRLINQGTYRASVSEALPCTNNNLVIMTEDYVECNNTRIAIMDSSTFNIMNTVTYTLYIIGLAYQFPALQIVLLESDLVY